MDRYSVISRLGGVDVSRLSGEAREFLGFIKKHLFNKVPSVSTLSGVAVGASVSSALATSPAQGLMSSMGVMDSSAQVISPLAYRLLSISIPLFAAATTVYLVQKRLKTYRKKQISRHKKAAERLDEGLKKELSMKLTLLDQAKESGLLTEAEYESKLTGLYHAYTGKPLHPGVEEFILKKLTS